MGAALLRVSKLQDKWRVKLARAIESKDSAKGRTARGRFKLWCEKYAMFTLPFITVLREGLEAVVFIGGISLGLPASSFPLPVILGIGCGCLVGYFIYRYTRTLLQPVALLLTQVDRGGDLASIQTFLIISTCFLYLVAAGLFSKAVWFLEISRVRINSSSTGFVCINQGLVDQIDWRRCDGDRIRTWLIRHPQECLACQCEYFRSSVPISWFVDVSSAATPTLMAGGVGVSSMLFLDGKIRQLTVPSSHTTHTGSP